MDHCFFTGNKLSDLTFHCFKIKRLTQYLSQFNYSLIPLNNFCKPGQKNDRICLHNKIGEIHLKCNVNLNQIAV